MADGFPTIQSLAPSRAYLGNIPAECPVHPPHPPNCYCVAIILGTHLGLLMMVTFWSQLMFLFFRMSLWFRPMIPSSN